MMIAQSTARHYYIGKHSGPAATGPGDGRQGFGHRIHFNHMKPKFLIVTCPCPLALLRRALPAARHCAGAGLFLAVLCGTPCRAEPASLAAPNSGLPGAVAPEPTKIAFRSIMHVHTRMSSGHYQLPELTAVAKAKQVEAIFLSDTLLESIQYGLPPWRHIFWAGHQEKPSVLALGIERWLAEIQRENERQPDVLYIPGVEVVPRFFWSGSLLKKNLVCHNHQRDLIVMGIEDPRSLANLPTTCGYQPGKHAAWIVATRLLLVLFSGAVLGMLFLPRRWARRSGYTAGFIRRAFFFGLVLPLALLMGLVNGIAGLLPTFDIYSPDDPARFEQRVLDALGPQNLVTFWAHPEAADHQDFKYCGVPFAVDTRPYPEVLLKTRGYTGFAGVNQGENKLVEPGSAWDALLKQYLKGEREEPPWCFGEMLYHYEGQAGKSLSDVETIIWAPEKKAGALLDSVIRGYFYARSNFRGQALTLDQWQVDRWASGQMGGTTNAGVEITLRVNSTIPGEKAEVLIVRNGEVIKKADLVLPLELNFRDNPPTDRVYYRALVSGKYPVRLVTNPIFIRLRQNS